MKKIVTSLIVTATYGCAVARGNSMKAKDKRDDAIDASIQQHLYSAFHGSLEAGAASFAEMFCTMTGSFAIFVKGGIASASDTLLVDDSDHMILNLAPLIRFDGHFIIDDYVKSRVKAALLNAPKPSSTNKSVCKPDSVVAGRTLINTFNQDVADVKKLMALEKKYLGTDGKIPSGKNVDDLVHYIWIESWKQKFLREQKTKGTSVPVVAAGKQTVESMSSDSEEEVATPEIDINGIESGELEHDAAIPDLQLNGKWFPKGWPVYVCYVFSHTRCTDSYYHLFVGGGKELDESAAKSRKQEREQLAESKTKKRKAALGRGEERGMDIMDKQRSVQLLSGESKDMHYRLSDCVATCHLKISNIMEDKKMVWQQLVVESENDATQMKCLPEWGEFTQLKSDHTEAKEALKKAELDLKTFMSNDFYGKASRQMLDGIAKVASPPPVSTVRHSTERAATPVSRLSLTSPPPVSTVRHSTERADTPVSRLSLN